MNTEPIKTIVSSRGFQLTVATELSGTISAAVSHILTKRQLDSEYAEALDKEIENTK